MKSLIILGRQPALGLAELESLYGAEALQPIAGGAVIVDTDAADIDFARLGGSVKLARILTELTTNSWDVIEEYLSDTIPQHLQYVPEGKFRLGLSAYGLRVSAREINATALRLKKFIKAEGRSVRIVPNKYPELNSAQVLHNQLTGPTGWELVAFRHGSKTILAQTYAEQDIEAYARRDQERPMRDAKVGMLPPKLAQIIINLTNPGTGETVLDPFCGTGVLLQEALLMGFYAYGTDIEQRMIDYTAKNLEWLVGPAKQRLEVGDATSHRWNAPVDVIAAETYLGKPLTSLPPRHVLEQIMKECDDIHEKFLQNIGTQIKPGTRLCLAAPAWKIKAGVPAKPVSWGEKNGFLHLKTLDHLEKMGYNRLSFVHVETKDLIYHRPDQTVARELVVLEKK